jgi:hypothetical protein
MSASPMGSDLSQPGWHAAVRVPGLPANRIAAAIPTSTVW